MECNIIGTDEHVTWYEHLGALKTLSTEIDHTYTLYEPIPFKDLYTTNQRHE